MKTILFSALALIISLSFGGEPIAIEQINIGASLPGGTVNVKEISGNNITLQEKAGKNGLLVIFSCNTCPYVVGWEDRYLPVSEFCKENNIGMVVLNSNEAKRQGEDSFEAMVAHAKAEGYTFPYAVDANHKLADLFGATKTPDVFLFNKDLKLVYKGSIDDNMKEPANVEESYLNDALKNMIAGKDIDPSKTVSVGCSIKRLAQ
jgi:hypothetical protein